MKTRLSLKYTVNDFRCYISSCYGTSRPIKREFTIYGTGRLGRKFANEDDTSRPSKRELTTYGTSRPRGVNKNAMTLLGQSRNSWPFIAPLGHVELKKMQKLLESKNENEKENQNQNENKNENSFLFSFSIFFVFIYVFVLFYFFSFCF